MTSNFEDDSNVFLCLGVAILGIGNQLLNGWSLGKGNGLTEYQNRKKRDHRSHNGPPVCSGFSPAGVGPAAEQYTSDVDSRLFPVRVWYSRATRHRVARVMLGSIASMRYLGYSVNYIIPQN